MKLSPRQIQRLVSDPARGGGSRGPPAGRVKDGTYSESTASGRRGDRDSACQVVEDAATTSSAAAVTVVMPAVTVVMPASTVVMPAVTVVMP